MSRVNYDDQFEQDLGNYLKSSYNLCFSGHFNIDGKRERVNYFKFYDQYIEKYTQVVQIVESTIGLIIKGNSNRYKQDLVVVKLIIETAFEKAFKIAKLNLLKTRKDGEIVDQYLYKEYFENAIYEEFKIELQSQEPNTNLREILLIFIQGMGLWEKTLEDESWKD